MKNRVIIVGAGASGMMAAVMAARQGAEVLLLEQKEAVGKKILATGNGHCNFTNRVMNADCYHGNTWVMEKLEEFGVEDTLRFFEGIGVFPEEKNGYYYPASGQASSVVSLFQGVLQGLGVTVVTDAQVKKIIPEKQGFTVEYIKTERSYKNVMSDPFAAGKKSSKGNKNKTADRKEPKPEIRTKRRSEHADKVILSCGGKASPKLGSDGSGYYLAGLLGHSIIKPLPALTGIRCEENWFGKLAGIRIPAEVSVRVMTAVEENAQVMTAVEENAQVVTAAEENAQVVTAAEENAQVVTAAETNAQVASATGELQLTDYGISGIPVFQISGPAARKLSEGKKLQISLHFHPEISGEVYRNYLRTHDEKQYTGLFPEALLEVLQEQKGSLATKTLCCTPVRVNDFDRAQVTTGGIPISEVDPDTLESLCCPGVYVTGELLDVDGICGGYNLQWAWTSGAIAGRSAAQNEVEQ